MKTFAFLTLAAVAGISLAGCADDFCDKVDCEGSGGGGTSSASTEAGPTSTASTSSSQPTSSSSTGDGGGSGSSSSGDAGGGGTGAGGDGGGGGAPPGCELVENQEIGDTCGIFVNAEASGDQDGSKGAPYNTLQQALDAAGDGETIYVCDSDGHDEAITIDNDVRLIGGLGCASWIWTPGGRTAWRAEANEIPLTVTNTANVQLSNFDIQASDATTPGRSSVAIFATSATVGIELCNVSAGSGADGEDELATGADPAAPNGTPGNDGCIDSEITSTPAAMGGQRSCGGISRNGGMSGSGTNDSTLGDSGNPGLPLASGGDLGAGEGLGPGGQCSNGGPGDPGGPGAPGAGADSDGVLGPAGFQSPAGEPGLSPGAPGSGGGGGGGANLCTGAGPSGGGGGAGGCGGDVGAPGGGAGASVAVVSFNSTLTIANTVLTTSNGGTGGDGAPGQPGQPGGDGGNSGDPSGACPGGNGGPGGQGGSAGGGRGGHSVGIIWADGEEPDVDGTVDFEKGTPGPGGAGGLGVDPNVGTEGADGSNIDVLEVETE